MRINLYFSETNKKDILIASMLESKYDAKSYIKELLYSIAKGESISSTVVKVAESHNEEKPVEEYENIKGLGNIDI